MHTCNILFSYLYTAMHIDIDYTFIGASLSEYTLASCILKFSCLVNMYVCCVEYTCTYNILFLWPSDKFLSPHACVCASMV